MGGALLCFGLGFADERGLVVGDRGKALRGEAGVLVGVSFLDACVEAVGEYDLDAGRFLRHECFLL